MHLSRRQFLTVLGNGVIAGVVGRAPALSADAAGLSRYGNLRLLHFTDCHAQLLPSWFREPGVNLGVGGAANRAPHLVGGNLLRRFDITDARFAHALTHLDFERAARKYGTVGGFAHLATLVKRLRADAGGATLTFSCMRLAIIGRRHDRRSPPVSLGRAFIATIVSPAMASQLYGNTSQRPLRFITVLILAIKTVAMVTIDS